ncbi:hypothetical protein POSPLADRAFT_1136419 [Postia placenta MAD-698-R-SB12]|uniref:Uncharacterized protein n=1 Tax=Postia placenta MAD-698-R-SB12 TaxID=670580 RepID=A0A1X6N9X1_9APHY|nr:hypothetical protein POSPLADRAFT_1136419 [Postia placenta MAD-698-R-SB12]OSX65310.1 hypothetical protein POSPLADRAFT_1136419 [Postia placenta MAD-698-R-SB12]
MDEIELNDLSTDRQSQHSIAPSAPGPASESVSSWAWSAAAVLVIASTPLLLFPRFLLFLAESNGAERRTTLTALESFLALHTGILLVAMAIALVLNIPSTSDLPVDMKQPRAPGHPLLWPLSGACAIIALISYNTASVGPLSLLLSTGAGVIALWGFWAIMFESSSSISKKTGADKHTSRFLFWNKAAASAQKKQWKKAQAERKQQ